MTLCCWPCLQVYETSELNKCTKANCEKFIPRIRRAKVVDVYDGDTCTIAAKLSTFGKPQIFKVRLNGIDTPEMRTKSKKEKEKAIAAKEALIEKIGDRIVTLDNVGLEKYGRVLADIHVDGLHVNQWLIDEGYAVPYGGGTKEKNWDDDDTQL